MALLPLQRKACCGLLSPLKTSIALEQVWTRKPWVQRQAR
jgi:hypothetical protein